MLAEVVHSLADFANQALLAYGLSSSRRAPDALHPYGYSKERFVWSLISAVGIFCLGSGGTIVHGIQNLWTVQPPENILYAALVIGGSFLIEGASLLVAIQAVKKGAAAEGMTVRDYVWRGHDPTSVAVMTEDGAAVAGLLIAGASLVAVSYTGNAIYDPIGSIIVGNLLVAIFLIQRNRHALIGRAMDGHDVEKVLHFLKNDPVVDAVYDCKSEVIGPGFFRFKAEIVTSSHVMLAEVVHSLADFANQALLAYGLSSSRRAPDALHPYGYSKERFVWSLISAVGIFCLGSGGTIVHGIQNLWTVQPPENILYAALVIGGSFLIEGASLLVAIQAVKKGAAAEGMTVRDYVWRGHDPTSVAVMTEDGAAVAGLLIAGASLVAVNYTGNAIYDPIGSSLTVGRAHVSTSSHYWFIVWYRTSTEERVNLKGLQNAAIHVINISDVTHTIIKHRRVNVKVAIFLIQRNRHALIGRAMDDHDVEKVLHFLKNDPVVDAVYDCKSEVIGPGFFRFKAEIDFNGEMVVQNYLSRTGREEWARQFHEAAKNDDSALLKTMSNYGEEVVTALGSEVDRLENEIQELVPGIRHVDIEAHNPTGPSP
ncbi:Metal tolerance protein C4 [Morella rubra]|uniref:Metal tolerance protein C4 n=1 Tax=Morella rubra TaxID=262757 RepID=A0A6A1VJL7_9ROSI|nr:Metal tolerance protein C4 [Morella rubra]